MQFAGLVEAATAAADEQERTSLKRKRDNSDDGQHDELSLQNSAAVLFREPSAKSRKYSRPPLGKVYSSLELAPEIFLKLQTACKDFMLDPSHPDRLEVVGHRRHSGGTDVAKLKLYNCVEEFLNTEGERYFGRGVGEHIPGAPPRTMYWPEDAQKIIKFCMPLMRKMVTNERQRLYAATTRSTKKDETITEEDHIEAVEENVMIEEEVKKNSIYGNLTILVSLVGKDGKRLLPRFSLTPDGASSLATLRSEVKKRMKGKTDVDGGNVKVWLVDGLVPVQDDGQWMVSLLDAASIEWMDGEVRVLIEV